MLDRFAEELKSARVKSGLTPDQLAAKTRIDKRYIEAIDNGNFSFLPEIYVRAFIKEYALFVGLDPEETLKKFKAATGQISSEELDSSDSVPEQEKKTINTARDKTYSGSFESSKHPGDKGINRNILLYSGSLFVLILIIAFLYFFFFDEQPEIIVQETPYEEVINSTPDRFVTEQANEESELSEITDSLVVTIASSGTSWVQIIKDNRKLEEFMLYPNSGKSVKAADNFEMILGNSGSLSIMLNQKKLDFSGEPGKVRYVRVDSTGLEYLNYRPTLKQN
ncbi:MAG: DUF4115 domain-containing protein [Ignavibacteriaceae bacterium]